MVEELLNCFTVSFNKRVSSINDAMIASLSCIFSLSSFFFPWTRVVTDFMIELCLGSLDEVSFFVREVLGEGLTFVLEIIIMSSLFSRLLVEGYYFV